MAAAASAGAGVTVNSRRNSLYEDFSVQDRYDRRHDEQKEEEDVDEEEEDE